MPARSRKQRIAMAIAEHNPGQLYDRNKNLLKMTHGQLHDFASTKGLGKAKAPNQLVRATGIGMQRNKMV